MTNPKWPDVNFDDELARWTIRFGHPGPAGWADVEFGDVLFRFDRADIDRLVEVRVDAPDDSAAPSGVQLAVIDAVLDGTVATRLRVGQPPHPHTELNAEALAGLSRLALAEEVRGEGDAWDVEIDLLRGARPLRAILDTPRPTGLDALRWVDGTADVVIAHRPARTGSVTDDEIAAAIASGADACDAERFAEFTDAAAHWQRCAQSWARALDLATEQPSAVFTSEVIQANWTTAAAMDVHGRVQRGAAGWLFLTEHRSRLGATTGLVVTEDDGLIRITTGPSGPAGTTTVRVGDVEVTVDTAEPERILEVFTTTEAAEAAGLGDLADLDVERIQSQLDTHLWVATAARDVDVLGEWVATTSDLRRLARAVYELAERLDAAGDTEAAKRWGQTGDGYLPAIAPLEDDLLERRQRLDRLLGALPQDRRDETAASAFRGAAPRGPVREELPVFMGAAEREAAPSIETQLQEAGAGLTVDFELLPGPLLRVRLDREADQPDVFLLTTTATPRMAEAVCRVWGPTAMTFPALGHPRGDVKRVPTERNGQPGRALARSAIAHELADRPASGTWSSAAYALVAEDEPDKAALALLRSLKGYPGPEVAGDPPEEVLDRLQRAALLGSSWALNRPSFRSTRSGRGA